MSRRAWRPFVVFLAHVLCVVAPASAGGTPDRLDRFRDLAWSRLSTLQLGTATRSVDDEREIYALLDDEIVQNLTSGGLFASPGFLQERLDGFAETWGGVAFRVLRVGPLVVGAFYLGDAGANSVRVYGVHDGKGTLLATAYREGRPAIHVLPGGEKAPAYFLVAWEGAPSGRGTRELRLDLVRFQEGDLVVAWSSADLFPDGLVARDYRLRGGEVAVRYELHYPGWIPGCDGQTEQEDVFRFVASRGTLARARSRRFNDWHVTLHESINRFFAALAAGDRGTLAALVPDGRLRKALPTGLARVDACDAREDSGPVSVAAVADTKRPWTLTFLRTGARWRLTDANPVLP